MQLTQSEVEAVYTILETFIGDYDTHVMDTDWITLIDQAKTIQQKLLQEVNKC